MTTRTIRLVGCGLALFMAICVSIALGGILIIGGGVPNRALNPIEGFALRIALLGKEAAINQPIAPGDSTRVRFTVERGQGAALIGANLRAQGLIADADLFRNYVRYYGLDSRLQAGIYLLRREQTLPEIAQALTNAGAASVRFRVIEGWRREQIAEALNNTPNLTFSGSEFLALTDAANAPAAFMVSVGAPKGATLEGFLYPATYDLPLDTTAVSFRDKLLAAFDNAVDAPARAAAAQQGLTLYQAVTLASIVEREAIVGDERPIIAGVYLNRLRLPMNLDADPTIQYALGKTRDPNTWWPQLTQADYRSVISPYNTYLNAGLPPSPIASPRRDSILAAIYPRQTPYFYFRASCDRDGRHRFAEDFQGHLANGCP